MARKPFESMTPKEREAEWNRNTEIFKSEQDSLKAFRPGSPVSNELKGQAIRDDEGLIKKSQESGNSQIIKEFDSDVKREAGVFNLPEDFKFR